MHGGDDPKGNNERVGGEGTGGGGAAGGGELRGGDELNRSKGTLDFASMNQYVKGVLTTKLHALSRYVYNGRS